MNQFEDLQQLWSGQHQPKLKKEGQDRLLAKIKKNNQKSVIMRVVLSITGIVLIGFFIYIWNDTIPTLKWALGLMLFGLALRGLAEWISAKRFNGLFTGISTEEFLDEAKKFYRRRRYVHYLITPLSLALYVVGFVLLLPLFEASLSLGFYLYIVYSSIVLLVVGMLFFGYQIKLENKRLKEIIFIVGTDHSEDN